MAVLQGLPAWVLAVAIAVVLARFALSQSIRRDGQKLRQAPNTLPLLGNGILFLQARQKLFSWFIKCERQFGRETLQISVPTLPPGVLIHDPRILDFVFKNEGVFAKGNFTTSRVWDLFGYGIINVDGELWRAQRKAGLHFLSAANLRVLTEVVLPQYLVQAIEKLRDSAMQGIVVDLQSAFHEITTRLMGNMAYNMDMQSEGLFTEAFEYASGASADRFQNPLWHITEIFFGARLRRSIAIVKKFGREIVATAVGNRQSAQAKRKVSGEHGSQLEPVSGSLIQSLLDSIQDEQVVADAALNYLSAGRDTTAQALTWAFYLLMNHPLVLSHICGEVSQVLSSQGKLPGSTPDSTLFTPISMPYTAAVFYETLRLYPPVPVEIKQCTAAVTLPDGTFLPKNSVVLWCLWSINRSRLTWGADADAFRPERWLVDGKLVAKSVSEFPVFNGGPRTCLGKRMAEVIGVQVIATVAWLFDFQPTEPGVERVSKGSLTLPMQGGLPCRVKTREN